MMVTSYFYPLPPRYWVPMTNIMNWGTQFSLIVHAHALTLVHGGWDLIILLQNLETV